MTLFQTYAWQNAWWRTWGNTPGFTLLAPGGAGHCGLYLDHYRLKRLFPIRCLQYTGTNYRRIKTPRAEYNHGIQNLDDISGARWDEAVFRDVLRNSDEFNDIIRLGKKLGCMVRIVASDTAYQIDTTATFDKYLESLSSGTRLRVFNRRGMFEAYNPESANYFPDKVPEFFALLNDFHVRRWGKPCFEGSSLLFHHRFLSEWEKQGRDAVLEVLEVNGSPVSLIYDVFFDKVIYNIQAGFDSQFDKKLSLGKLHLGYRIETAFNDHSIQKYDLLAGRGRAEDYKKSIAGESVELVSLMLVRNPILKCLYRLNNWRAQKISSDKLLFSFIDVRD